MKIETSRRTHQRKVMMRKKTEKYRRNLTLQRLYGETCRDVRQRYNEHRGGADCISQLGHPGPSTQHGLKEVGGGSVRRQSDQSVLEHVDHDWLRHYEWEHRRAQSVLLPCSSPKAGPYLQMKSCEQIDCDSTRSRRFRGKIERPVWYSTVVTLSFT